MHFLVPLVALVASNPMLSLGVPIPQTRTVSPYVTQFTERTAQHGIRGMVAGLVTRIPDVLDVQKDARDDIFLARALEDPVFASAQDVAFSRRSNLERRSLDNAVVSTERRELPDNL
ncbi:hypothetical protein B0H10DRAFT_1949109 [Mycena sp. CBHHK59/15]|nr:hypothetical protein B0H10DRAFT_1949109 [Mycena sp. CBHHK59/15]